MQSLTYKSHSQYSLLCRFLPDNAGFSPQQRPQKQRRNVGVRSSSRIEEKIAVIVFYRPPDSDLKYIKEFKKSLQLIERYNKFDQVIVCGDFSLPSIDWTTGIATKNNNTHRHFTKTVKDHYLWQLVGFPTRFENTVDLILTNIPEKIENLKGFDDVLPTDHKLISFEINLKIEKNQVARFVYDFEKADWFTLKVLFSNTRWDLCLVPGNIDKTLSNCKSIFSIGR